MSFAIEKTKSGKPCIIFNNVKYRQQRILKNKDVSWRCLGKRCGASIKTDANMTQVTVCNQKHTGEHPVTMRSLSSPLTNVKAYECGDQPHEQAWTEIKNKNKNKKKPTGQTTMNRHHTPPTKTLHPNPKAPHHPKIERPPIEKTKQKHPSQKYRKPSQTSIPFIHKVHINGDSHTRHIAELVDQLTCPATS
ncbi:hypothetical protein J6590_107969, partial [Homalodisca vitripennis]